VPGARWVVQSWLPEAAYGFLDRLPHGDGAVLVFNGALAALVAAALHRLARPAGSPLRTTGAALVAALVGSAWWSPRPLLVGLLCFAAFVLVVEERRHPALLVPVLWVWVNSHGSFPLGVAWLGAWAFGSFLDDRASWRRSGQLVAAAVGGLVVSCVNPLGPRLLAVPFGVGDRTAVFRNIVEWQSPRFQSIAGICTLVGLGLALVLLSRRRMPWRDALPVVAFVLIGLLSVRNLLPLGIVLAAPLGRAVATGREPAAPPPWRPIERGLGALVAAGMAIVLLTAAGAPALDLSGYPVAVVTDAEQRGLMAKGHTVAAQDVVGCYLILRWGRGAGVFIDDRFDMYPAKVSEDYLALLKGSPDALAVLHRRHVDTVLWDRHAPLPVILRADGWQEVGGDTRWVLLREPAPAG
jgi:hypothetical protein